jgi:MFS transporter, DHA2 family, multidrug resistance protein
VLLPIYLQTLMGYPALNAGLAISPRGIGALATTPLAGYLTGKTDARRLMVFGLVLGSFTMFSLSGLNLNAGFWDILWPQVIQGIALSFLFIPLMTLSMSGIPKEKMGNATSIYNLMRNIGGSLGIASMTTFLARRSQMHQNHLVSNIHSGDLPARRMLQGAQAWFHLRGFDNYTASRKALGVMYGMVQQHATMLSFVEAFWVMGVMFLAMLPFVLLLRNPRKKRQPPAHPRVRLTRVEVPLEIPEELVHH